MPGTTHLGGPPPAPSPFGPAPAPTPAPAPSPFGSPGGGPRPFPGLGTPGGPNGSNGERETGETAAPDGTADERTAAFGARSSMASEALMELSRLSSATYMPSFAPAASNTSAGLTRRARRADEVDGPVEQAGPPPRQRSAEDVRNLLSGFRAGVTRARTEDEPAPRGPADDPPAAQT